MMKTPRGSRHAFLREATAEVHKSLEAVIEERAYLKMIVSYGQYLQRLHAFHQGFHGAMRHRCEDLAKVWRLEAHEAWLARDLDDLGLKPHHATDAGSAAPFINGRASAFGAAYVVFGSALGARVLLKRVQSLALPDGCGLTYLASLATSHNWPQFLSGLEAEPHLSEPELLRGALATFESFKVHMTRSILQ